MQRQLCSILAAEQILASLNHPALKVALMGQFLAELDGVTLDLPSRVAQSMFAYLALNAGKSVRREKLAGVFWPDLPEANARNQLRHTVWRIRKAISQLGHNGLAFIPESTLHVQLCVGPAYQLDVADLLQPIIAAQSAETVMAQLSKYDELLPGFSSPRDEWIHDWQYRLEHAYACKGLLLMDRLMREGRWHDALDWGSRLLMTTPFIESVQQKMAQTIQNLTDQWQPYPRPPNQPILQ